MSAQGWIDPVTWGKLTAAQQEGVQAAWAVVDAQHGEDRAAWRAARNLVVAIADAWASDHAGIEDSFAANVSHEYAEAEMLRQVALARAKALAAILLARGDTDLATHRALGVGRQTLLRWFGRGTR